MSEIKGVPSREEAFVIIKKAEETNPGAWIDHSKKVARAARLIAHQVSGMDPDVAYVLGLLHDIGRKDGDMHMKHILVGYYYLKGAGFDKAASICLTHSFPYKNVYSIYGPWDCCHEDIDFVSQYIQTIEYDDYDKLIQLCDSFSMATGYLLIEKKMINSIIRYGSNEYTVNKLRAILSLKNYFDEKAGQSIYHLLPGVIQNTFGITNKT